MTTLTSAKIIGLLIFLGLFISCGDNNSDQRNTPVNETSGKADQRRSPLPDYREELTDDDYITFIDGEKVSTKEMNALQYIKLCGDLSKFTELAYKSAVIRDQLQEVKPIVLMVPTDEVMTNSHVDYHEKDQKGNLSTEERIRYIESFIFLQKRRSVLGDTLWIKHPQQESGLRPLFRFEDGWKTKGFEMEGEPVRVQNGLIFRISQVR